MSDMRSIGEMGPVTTKMEDAPIRLSEQPCSALAPGTVPALVQRGYRVAQAMTAEGLQAIVNNLLDVGFEPVGGVSVTLIGTMHEEPLVLHTQGLFYTSNR